MRKAMLLVCGVILVLLATVSGAQEDDLTGDLAVIAPENVADLQEVASIGRARAGNIAMGGDTIAIGTEHGVWLYDATALDAPPRLLEPSIALWQVAFNPAGTIVVGTGMSFTDEGNADFAMLGWDVETGELLFSHYDPDETIATDAIFSADGSMLAVSGYVDQVLVWPVDDLLNTSDPEPMLIPVGDDLNPFTLFRLAFSADGTTGGVLFQAWQNDRRGEMAVRVWDAATSEILLTLDNEQLAGSPQEIVLNDDGSRLIVGDAVWDVSSGEQVRTLAGTQGTLWRMLTIDGGKRLLVLDLDQEPRLWVYQTEDALAGEAAFLEIDTERGASFVQDIGATPTQAVLLYGDGTISVRDLVTGEETAFIDSYGIRLSSYALSQDGRLLALGADFGAASVQVWDTTTGELQLAASTPPDPDGATPSIRGRLSVDALAFDPTGTWLAAYVDDGRVYRFDLGTGEPTLLDLTTLNPDFVPTSFDRTLDFVGNTLFVWNGELVKVLDALGLPEQLSFESNGFAAAPDDTRYATVTGTLLQVIDRASGEPLMGASASGTLRPGAFSQDGERVALYMDNFSASGSAGFNIDVYDVDTGEMSLTLAHAVPVAALAWSPAGDLIASADRTGDLYLWDATTGDLLRQIDNDIFSPVGLVFSLDGRRLYDIGSEGSVRVWGVPAE